jgi:muconolactone delta-isomerase
MEFPVRLEISLPEANREKIISAERAMAADLRRDGKLLRVWRDPAQKATGRPGMSKTRTNSTLFLLRFRPFRIFGM